MKSVTYKSSDGLEIPAYLTLPKGVRPRSCPRWSFRTAARGGATNGATTRWRSSSPIAATPCCSPISAARPGYGKKFLDAGNLRVGPQDAG